MHEFGSNLCDMSVFHKPEVVTQRISLQETEVCPPKTQTLQII